MINRNKVLKLYKLCKEHTASRVFWFIYLNSDRNNCFTGGNKVIADALHANKKNISQAIQYLNDNGFIRTEKFNGCVSLQWVNPDIIWRTKPENRKLCGFIEDKKDRAIYSFNNFIQINFNRILRVIFNDILLEEPKAFDLFIYVLLHMDYNREYAASKTELANALDSSQTSIWRYSKILMEKGIFRIYEAEKSNGYQIFDTIASRDNKTQCSDGRDSFLTVLVQKKKGGMPYDE